MRIVIKIIISLVLCSFSIFAKEQNINPALLHTLGYDLTQILSESKSAEPRCNELSVIELATIKFYTRDGFKLINGSFNFDKLIIDYMNGKKIDMKKFLEIKYIGTELALVMRSALQKLKTKKEKIIYRGDNYKEDDIKKLEIGQRFSFGRFLSFSTDKSVAFNFATANSHKYGGIPVLFIVKDAKNARNIDPYSVINMQEDERVFIDTQEWKILKIEEVIDYDEEEIEDEKEIKEAQEKDELEEVIYKENGVVKTRYFIKIKNSNPQKILNVYLREH